MGINFQNGGPIVDLSNQESIEISKIWKVLKKFPRLIFFGGGEGGEWGGRRSRFSPINLSQVFKFPPKCRKSRFRVDSAYVRTGL